MPISQAIFEIIPVGEENAVSGRLLWKQLGMWSAPSIKAKLNEMAAAGLIERKRVVRGAHDTNLYFRSRLKRAKRAIAPGGWRLSRRTSMARRDDPAHCHGRCPCPHLSGANVRCEPFSFG
jgi:hypothetical protein